MLRPEDVVVSRLVLFVIYFYFAVVIFIDYSDMGKMMDINNDKC